MLRIQAYSALLICGLTAACGAPDAMAPMTETQTSVMDVQQRPGLTPAQREVGSIATRNGDRDFIMIDKAAGQIIMFHNGQAAFSGSALTGMSLADRLPPGAENQSFSQNMRPDEKVTPAGRFTVHQEPDPSYGPTLSVNEVHGPDWDIAIHRIWVGPPHERRLARLASPNPSERHITWGCVDVAAPIMQRLIAELPNQDETPLYILPTDQTNLGAYFSRRGA